MEVYKYRIKKSNPSVYWTVPCTGGTNFYPINTSPNCSGLTMYNSTFSQVQNALQGDMNNFPVELTACSTSNPCILLNDTTTMPVFGAPPPYGNTSPLASPFCLDVESHPYVIFAGLNLFQSGIMTFTGDSYNDLISVFSLTNSTLSKPLNQQTTANLTPNTVSCFCPQPVFNDLYQIPVMLDQDYNDIGHYDVWDGNMGQQDIFSNFIVTATTALGNKIKVTNTTDFGYYKSYQNSPYTIDWGDCPCNCLVPPCINSFGDPCCESLQFPNLTNPVPHTYAGVGTRRITITHENEWGPTSVSQAITVPFMPYNTLESQTYNAALNTGIAPSNAPVIGPNGPVGTNSYFGAYPFSPLDSGTDIMQYSGMSTIFGGGNIVDCFDVTGNTQSLLGAFQSYSTLQTGNLPPGYQAGVDVPLMGDVLNPLTNQIEQGVMGRILLENTQYTSYTISIGTNTPITFYDFSNGVTLYEAVSCGLDAFAFGAFDCVKCEIGDCTYCETKDEYIDRITTLPEPISFNPGTNTNWGEWIGTTNYIKGDIVFDSTWGDCCCYMAVKDITQTGGTIDPWAGIKPTAMVQGVWWFNGQPTEHIWEACTPECESCPDYTSIPCYDPTNSWNAFPTTAPVGPAGVYSNGNLYTTGQFTLGQWGNCYRALSGGTLPPPSGLTNNTYWDYIGCSSWVCPPVSALTASSVSCELVPGTGSTNTGPCTTVGFTAYEDCTDAFYLGNCCEDRYICIDQYSCQGCSAMTSAHPLYNDPSSLDPNQGPVFDNIVDCEAWCEPPAYSCVTNTPQSGGNCCGILSCSEDVLNGTTFYIDNVLSVMSTLPSTPAPFLNFVDYAAFNFELFFAPYGMSDCNAGFTNSSGTYTGCCDFTRWVYNCEEGCKPVFVGSGHTTEADCYTANPQWLGLGNTPCGYECDPICDPCNPCYTLNCGGYQYTPQGLMNCTMNCSCATECYVCDCLNVLNGSNIPCYQYVDATGAASCPYWPPDPLGSPPTFYSAQDCTANCECPGGYDCFVYDEFSDPALVGTQVGGCTFYASLYLMGAVGVTYPPGSPTDPNGNPTGYTSFEECCNATECCRVVCENDSAQVAYLNYSSNTTTGPALQSGGGGTTPCYWISQTDLDQEVGPGNVNCCSPAYVNTNNGTSGMAVCFTDHPGLPYCDMVDCVNYLCPDPYSTTAMTCCTPIEETCDCACLDWLSVNGIPTPAAFEWSGVWSSINTYNIYETVSYGDANTEDCCWICMCPILPATGAAGYDCDSSPPDDGNYPDGTPNCWQTCDRLPSYMPTTPTPVIGDPCGPCDGPSISQTYQCTTSGCVTSTCVFNPPASTNISIWQTQNNCYTASTCGTQQFGLSNDQCRADCYCADPGPPTGGASEISSCTVLQDYLNDIYSPGTGNLGINFMGYSPYPFTYPPVQPGIVFNFTGTYFWPYDSLDTCETQLATGMFDCCTGTTSGVTTWECDSSCNCPIVGGNPCVGGVGCYPVSGPSGTFTSLIACQEWCTWECNTNGAQVCQFVPMSLASTTYNSAFQCQTSNANCECSSVEEWWCDWAGADAGVYNTVGSQPCQPNSFFAGQGSTYQSQAIGQAAGGPSDPNNNYNWAVANGNMLSGLGFPNQSACEQKCRFCCDCAPPGSGLCDLCGDPTVLACSWGDLICSGGSQSCGTNLPSSLSPGDCGNQQFISTGTQTCIEPQTEYCCHAVDGCISYIGAAPNGSDGNPCVTFFGTNAAACTNECNFVCGDCVPPAGDCHCQFVNSPVLAACSPYPFNNMADCETYVTTLALVGDAGSCCKCYECSINSPITYSMYDQISSWVIGFTTVTMVTGALPWVSGQVYNIGDVVTYIFDGSECCYVCVWEYTPDWTIPPYFFYQAYVNDVNTSTPVWPGGGTGSLMWVPCDPSCVPGVQVTTYDCIPGTITDSCSSLSLIIPPVTLLSGYDFLEMIGNPSGIPYLQTTNITTIKFPYGGFATSTPNPCLHNGLPLALAGSWIGIHVNASTTLGVPNNYPSWSNMITNLSSAGVTNSAGNVVSLSDDFDSVCLAINAVWGSFTRLKCLTFNPDPCQCTQAPCICQLVNGPTGVFNNLSDCQLLLNNNPCCGTWTCPGGTNCECVFQPNILTGFASQADCYNASNCCEVTYPEYICDQVAIVGPVGSQLTRCDCVVVGTGLGTYIGPNALYDCENDPNTCCSATTLPDRWKCTAKCSCVVDPYGPYATLSDCQTAINSNCCYTGSTKLWECVDFGGTVGCDCVQTGSGTYTTKPDCEADMSDCCYTGGTNFSCVVGTNALCNCIPDSFGSYTSLFNCENGIPLSNCCEKQSTDCVNYCSNGNITPTYIKHDGYYLIALTQTFSLASTNILGLWLSGTFYGVMDTVKDPYDDCCYVLVGNSCHFVGSDIMNYSPSQIYQNHLLGLFYNGTTTPTLTAEQNAQNRGPIWWPCDPNCSTTPPDTGYDCFNCPGTCSCVINNTGTAQYQGPNALSLCVADCVEGCEDCAINLSNYLTGPVDYEGMWYSTFLPSYEENDCVTDPADGCCYCCVSLVVGPGPSGSGPQLLTRLSGSDPSPCIQNVSCAQGFVWQGAPVCACVPDGPGGSGSVGIKCNSYYQPSLNVGVNIGNNATWMDCKIQTNGDPCTVVGTVDCNNCDNYMANTWGLTLPLVWKSNPIAYQHFIPGMCVYDPTAECCYCCVESVTGDVNDFGPGWIDHDGLEGPGFPSTAPCSIYDMNPTDGVWELYGTLAGAFNNVANGWVSCSPTLGVPCAGGVTSINYACTNQPVIGNPGNMACTPDPTGPYTSLLQCQNSPCPPAVVPCKECCGKLNKDGSWSYQKLPTTSNPCDCLHWLGIGWSPQPASKCCIQTPCPPGMYWSQIDCMCKTMPNIAGPSHGINEIGPCVQTESCSINHYWDWVKCGCVLRKEPCTPKKCKTGEVWNSVNCRCDKLTTEPDTPINLIR